MFPGSAAEIYVLLDKGHLQTPSEGSCLPSAGTVGRGPGLRFDHKSTGVPMYVDKESVVIDFLPHEFCKATENEAQMGETTYCLTCISNESVNTVCFQ